MKRRKEVGKGRAKNLSGDEGEKVERLFFYLKREFLGGTRSLLVLIARKAPTPPGSRTPLPA